MPVGTYHPEHIGQIASDLPGQDGHGMFSVADAKLHRYSVVIAGDWCCGHTSLASRARLEEVKVERQPRAPR